MAHPEMCNSLCSNVLRPTDHLLAPQKTEAFASASCPTFKNNCQTICLSFAMPALCRCDPENKLKLKFREIAYNEKSTEFLQCFCAPELGLEPRTL